MSEGEYKKRTKKDINFPAYLHALIVAFNKRLKSKDWTRSAKCNCIVCTLVKGSNMKYCSDGIEVLQRILSDDKWDVSLRRYKVSEATKDAYVYTWYIESKVANLPYLST